MRWSSKWAILWPPPGILTTILIFLRLFGLCYKHSFKNKFDTTFELFRNSMTMIKAVSHLRGRWEKSLAALDTTLQVLTVYALAANDVEQIKDNVIHWDSDSVPAVLDNSANTHIWSRIDDFVEGSLHYFDHTETLPGVMTIGNEKSNPVGTGTVIIKIRDKTATLQEIILKNVLYFPSSPVNVISVTSLADQFGDNDGTWIKTKRYSSVFVWNFGQFEVEFDHPSSSLPVFNVCPGTTDHAIFCSLFD